MVDQIGNVIHIGQIMSADLYSKLTEVIEQVPRDVLYDFCCSYYAYNIKRTLRLSFVLFDQWVKHQTKSFPMQHVGLKFFNVYGPNEYFKGSMASMVFHGFNQIKADGEIRLFKSCNPGYEDGGQLRDFVYVKDICKVIAWMLQHPAVSGLFNVGTGHAQSFRELAEATFHRHSSLSEG